MILIKFASVNIGPVSNDYNKIVQNATGPGDIG